MDKPKSYRSNKSYKKKETIPQVQTQKTVQPILFKRFLKFLTKSKQTKLVNGIYNYYGKNFSIEYKDKFNFHQRWEEQRNDSTLEDYLEDGNIPFSLLSLVTLIMNTFTIWVLSTQRYFGRNLISKEISLYYILIGLKVIEISLKTFLKCKRDEWNRISSKNFIKLNFKEFACLIYYIYMLIETDHSNILQYMVELIVYYLLWNGASSIYRNFKLRSFALKYENQLKIFDLLINIFIQAHVFSIMMELASTLSPSNNWIQALNITDAPIFTRYIYAFYFSCTTMLTIGYGDITPKNPGQIVIVILIQITGVVSFGYLLNQMGHTLSKMRQEQEVMEKDLQTIGKMANYYNLQKSLENKAKKYIVTNNKVMDQLRPDEENRLLMKLNDELRTQITNQNRLSILKTSIFYLCHWSKGFQSEIAKSLQKKLFSPNERLGDMNGADRIYIIKTGKVCVYMNRFNSHNKKLLRTIEIKPNLTVSNNIYGYTSVFSNRMVHLQAQTKELTTTYSISKDHFLYCVGLDKKDFQYFHEIKCKIDQSSFCEQWEAPAIKNIRQHYIPSKIFLIKKYRAKLTKETNERVGVRRRNKHKYKLFNNFIISNAQSINPLNSSYTLGDKTLEFKISDPIYRNKKAESINFQSQFSEISEIASQLSQKNLNFSDSSEKSNLKERSMELAREHMKTRLPTLALLEESQNKQSIADRFEKQRDYSNFFPKNNFNTVLHRCQRQNSHQFKLYEAQQGTMA